jgi:uncharacterized protein (TIGR03083 family)
MNTKTAAGTQTGGLDRAQLHDSIRGAADRIASMLRSVDDTSVAVPGSDWTVGDVGAHVVLGNRLYRNLLAGGTSPFSGRDDFFTDGRARSRVNAELLKEYGERRGSALADLVVKETELMLQAASRLPATHSVRWHWVDLNITEFTCIGLLHDLEHGYDIAKALRRRHDISPEDARLALQGLVSVMPLFLDAKAAASLRACLQIRVRGGSRAWLVIEDGSASVHHTPPGRPVDCYVSADPVALLLVALGRVGQWGPIAAGRLVSWGRRPWLALRLTTLFPTPG